MIDCQSKNIELLWALKIASNADSKDAWMWVAETPESTEDILISVAFKKNIQNIKALVALHKNATDRVIRAMMPSYSEFILMSVLANDNLSDDLKLEWINNKRAMFNAYHYGGWKVVGVYDTVDPKWQNLFKEKLRELKEQKYIPPRRSRRFRYYARNRLYWDNNSHFNIEEHENSNNIARSSWSR